MTDKQQRNYRLPSFTLAQLEALIAKMGGTETQIIIVAIDRLAQQELTPEPDAEKRS